MTLEDAFTIVLRLAHARINAETVPRLQRNQRKAWEQVSDYALNEAANRKEFQDEEN